MVAWVVMFSIDPRRATQCRHVTKIPSPQLLLFPALTNCDARNPFRIRSYEKCRVACQRFPFWNSAPSARSSNAAPATPNLCLFTLFQTLFRSSKTQLVSFQAIPNSFAKTPGVGVEPESLTDLNWLSSTPSDRIASLPTLDRQMARAIEESL
jgi:hypothetical protein